MELTDGDLISPDKLASKLRTSKREIGETIGIPSESLSRKERVSSNATQTSLRHLIEILNAVTPMVGNLVMAYAWFALGGPAQGWFIASGAVYVLGTFLVTLFGNVPMNRRLDAMAVEGPETEAYWAHYAVAWTRWNPGHQAGAKRMAVAHSLFLPLLELPAGRARLGWCPSQLCTCLHESGSS